MSKQSYSELSPLIDGKFPVELEYQINNRIEKNKPSLIIIDGLSGEGKTTFCIHALELAQRIMNIKNPLINYEFQYAMGGEQFQKKLVLCLDNNLKTIIYDEAGDYSKKNWQFKVNKNIDRIFDVYRTFKILPFVIVPNFSVLSKELFLKGIPRLLIHCYARTEKQGKYSLYSNWRMQYLKYKMDDPRLVIKQSAYSSVMPNSRGQFRNLPPDRERELNVVCSQGKLNILNKFGSGEEEFIRMKDIAEYLGISIHSTGVKLTEKGIVPDKKIGARNYYKKSVLAILDR